MLSYLTIGLNILLLVNIFYFTWTDTLLSVVLFLLSLLWVWKVDKGPKVWRTTANILLFGLYPFVYLLSWTTEWEVRLIISLLYIPVILKLVPAIVDVVYEEKKELFFYTNLIYLYLAPVLIFLQPSIAYGFLGAYALVYFFDWHKFILKPIPVWERIVHIVGLSSILLLVSILLGPLQ